VKKDENLAKAISCIIGCTRRVKRTVDLITLAENISLAKDRMRSLQKVADHVSLSVQQMRDFLTVEKLCSEVRELVRRRDIDSVDAVKNIARLPEASQRVVAKEIVSGRINSKDLRIIASFAKRFPEKSIHLVLKDYYASRDVKTYVVESTVQDVREGREARKKFEKIVGKQNVIMFCVSRKQMKITIEFSREGILKLRAAAKLMGDSLRALVKSIL